VEVGFGGPVSDNSLDLVVQFPSKINHAPSSLLGQRKDIVIWTIELEAHTIAVICVVVPKFMIAGNEMFCSRRKSENGFNGGRKTVGKAPVVDIFADLLRCHITVVGTIVKEGRAIASTAPNAVALIKSVNTL
jgi:hypothetical protein